jgi:hypothetical protein
MKNFLALDSRSHNFQKSIQKKQQQMSTIKLVSNEGTEFAIDYAHAKFSSTIKNIVDVTGNDDGTVSGAPITIPNITTETMGRVVTWLTTFAVAAPEPGAPEAPAQPAGSGSNDPKPDTTTPKNFNLLPPISDEKLAFLGEVDESLMNLLKAAHFLNLQDLTEAIAICFGKFVLGATRDEIRARFGVTEEYTPEELAKVKEANAWAMTSESLLA